MADRRWLPCEACGGAGTVWADEVEKERAEEARLGDEHLRLAEENAALRKERAHLRETLGRLTVNVIGFARAIEERGAKATAGARAGLIREAEVVVDMLQEGRKG